MYNRETIKHFNNPHNYGKMKDPDAVGKVGNIICGDVMWLYIKVAKNKEGDEIIDDIKFETFGCVAAVATSSMITDLAKGKRLDQALSITKEEIAGTLGGLPPIKLHCSVLAADALSEAIYNYLLKKKRDIPEELGRRHKRVIKESEIIEEKYKDWIKQEEEMHKAG